MVTGMLDTVFAEISDGANLSLYFDQGWQHRNKQSRGTSGEKAFVGA